MIKTFRILTIIFLLLGTITVFLHSKAANILLLIGLFLGLVNVFQEKNILITKYRGSDLDEIPENEPFVVNIEQPYIPIGRFLRLIFLRTNEEKNCFITERFFLEGNDELKKLPKGEELVAFKRQKLNVVKEQDLKERVVTETVYYIEEP